MRRAAIRQAGLVRSDEFRAAWQVFGWLADLLRWGDFRRVPELLYYRLDHPRSYTSVLMQNRGTSFSLKESALNRLAPGRLPFHTLSPAGRSEIPLVGQASTRPTAGGGASAADQLRQSARCACDRRSRHRAVGRALFGYDGPRWRSRAAPQWDLRGRPRPTGGWRSGRCLELNICKEPNTPAWAVFSWFLSRGAPKALLRLAHLWSDHAGGYDRHKLNALAEPSA